jgi:hypothetical protein
VPLHPLGRSASALALCGLLLAACTATAPPPDAAPPPDGPYMPVAVPRAFTADSWWNAPVPGTAPDNPGAAAILEYMSTAPEAGNGCVRLAGADESGWGQPVYWSRAGDRTYDVAVDRGRPPVELRTLRIPATARAAATSDEAMTVYDLDAGYVVALSGAKYDADADAWSARGATVTYLASNGLDEETGRSDDPRNVGSHRGNNGATMMVRHDEVVAGSIDHVLKVASGPEASTRAVFPMVGSDGDSTDPVAPPQGLRFRIRPTVDIAALDLAPEAKVIARALQQYGFYIGDSAGVTALKLENTRVEGRGQLWQLPPTALCSLPLSEEFWQVLPEGYDPSAEVG